VAQTLRWLDVCVCPAIGDMQLDAVQSGQVLAFIKARRHRRDGSTHLRDRAAEPQPRDPQAAGDGEPGAAAGIDFGVRDFSPHRTRGTAATLLREHGFGRDVVEQLVVHSEKNATVAADSHRELPADRKRALQRSG